MKGHRQIAVAGWAIWLAALATHAEVKTVVEHVDNHHTSVRFKFDAVPPPSRNDAATDARFTVVFGKIDKNADNVDRLHDGKVPDWEDQPLANFAFAGRESGRLLIDLGRVIDVAQVNTYSWHPGPRGPQVYTLFAAEGSEKNFDPKPGRKADPLTSGWKKIATVNTWPRDNNAGGQYGVSTFDTQGTLGKYRYLLFDISRTRDTADAVHTFYSEIDVVEAGSKPSPVAAYESLPPERDPPGDPMDFKPPAQPPALVARYDDAKYGRLAAAVRKEIDLNALRAPGRPSSGLLVQEVIPGQQAAKLGIRPGDILMSLDDAQLGTGPDEQMLDEAENDQPQQLTYWSPTGGQKSVKIQPGLLGVVYYSGRRLADAYARSAERDPQWDDDMLVAATTFMTEPYLAETALFRAQNAGYHGMLMVPLAARIAFYQCRFDDTLSYGWPLWSQNQHLSRDMVTLFDGAARLGFKLEQSLDISRRYPKDVPKNDLIATAVNTYRAMPKSNLADPLTELNNVHRTRIRKIHPPAPKRKDPDWTNADWAASLIDDRDPVHLHVATGRFLNAFFAPGFPNVALAVHVNVHDTDSKDPDYSHLMSFGVYDMTKSHPSEQEPDDQPPADMLQVNIETDGSVVIYPFALPPAGYAIPRFKPEDATHLEGTLRLVVLHNRCIVTFNDRRLYYGPVLANESKRRYGFFFKDSGVSGNMLPPVWEQLEDPRSPTSQPATQPAEH